MHVFVFISVPESHAALLEQIARSAVCFLETRGPVERQELGRFRRAASKGKSFEIATFVKLAVGSEAHAAEDGRERALESVLRATLTAAGVQSGDVRVFAEAR